LLPSPRILAALVAVSARLDDAAVPWLLTGGTARALLGSRRPPADLDLEVDDSEVARAARALGLGVRRDGGGGVTSMRATGRFAGVGVDLSAGITVRGPAGVLTPDWPRQMSFASGVRVAGRDVRLAPVEEMLARALVREDAARAGRLLDPDLPPPRVAYLAARLCAAISSATS
jgi:hypothetical protein